MLHKLCQSYEMLVHRVGLRFLADLVKSKEVQIKSFIKKKHTIVQKLKLIPTEQIKIFCE